MNAESKAWQEYLNSDKGKTGSDPITLGAPASQRQYLENRLYCAFMAALEAGKRIASDRVKQKLASLVDDAVRN